jgi:hypothetical protein
VRVVKHISVSLLTLLLAASAAAQMRNPPPASIYSIGGTTLGGPPASIYSLPSQPVGVGRTCCSVGINFGPGHNFAGGHHLGRNGHHGARVIGIPVFYPVYPYDSYTDVEQPAESMPGAGTFDRPRYAEDTEPVSARAPEPRPRDRADDSRYGEHYLDSRAAQPPAPVAPAPEPSEAAATLLVFRDGHRLEVRNYAIMGSTLFIITPERRKIPLSELDLQATARENDDRGVDFRVPSATE